MTETAHRTRGPVRRWLADHPGDVVDVFVYVVVLNLAVEYFPTVISETFTLSLLTALLLKVALEAVIRLKSAILDRRRAATRRTARAAALGSVAGKAGRSEPPGARVRKLKTEKTAATPSDRASSL